MCLDTIARRYNRPDPKVRKAWKILNGNGETPFTQTPILPGKWMHAYPTEAKTHSSRDVYMAGFHVFATKKDAVWVLKYLLDTSCTWELKYRARWKVVACKVRGILAEGADATSYTPKYLNRQIHTLVADELFIPEVQK